ncbi:MAG: 23S rRNA pseudouridine1911/1915/1917 synthase [Planctomycetota bacterium]
MRLLCSLVARVTALNVLHCDNHLLAVYKPAGLPIVPDESGDPSLFDIARDWIEAEFNKPGRAFLGVVHRLDRPVSGVVLFARTSKAANRLTSQFRERTVRKRYLGICQGLPSADEGRIEHWLIKNRSTNRVSVCAEGREGAKLAITSWRVLQREARTALLGLKPKTGRSHQLRVAAASMNVPLLGDLKYGARDPLPDKSIALHAESLEIEHPTLKERLTFRAQVPSGEWWDLARG